MDRCVHQIDAEPAQVTRTVESPICVIPDRNQGPPRSMRLLAKKSRCRVVVRQIRVRKDSSRYGLEIEGGLSGHSN